MRFLYTPGHAVDEIMHKHGRSCVYRRPHPAPDHRRIPRIKQALSPRSPWPEHRYRRRVQPTAGECYGLESYIRSLGRTLQLERSATVLPAHRLFNHGRFNVRNLRRAQEIVRHHVRRLDRLMDALDEGADTPEKLAAEMFPPRKLTGGGFFSAVSEVVSHLELLADSGDVFVYQDGRLARNGTNSYRTDIEAMTS